MKTITLILLLGIPFVLVGQKKLNSHVKMELWTSGGFMPLKKGGAIYSKTEYNFERKVGLNIGFGYGIANPISTNNANISDLHAQGSFFSAGVIAKTTGMSKYERKLSLYVNPSLVLGQGKESARYYFKGNDFGDYFSPKTYTQKYDFVYLQLAMGLTYLVDEKWNLELGTYIIAPNDKNRLEKQYFKVFDNYAYAYTGRIGANFGISYLLWSTKS